MSLKDIAKAKIVKKTIDLDGGVSFDIYLRPEPFYMVWDKKDEKGNELTDNQILARRVSYCIVDEDEVPVFTYDQIIGTDPDYKADPAIVLKLATVIGEETNPGKHMMISLDKPKSSGASLSLTESAEEQ